MSEIGRTPLRSLENLPTDDGAFENGTRALEPTF